MPDYSVYVMVVYLFAALVYGGLAWVWGRAGRTLALRLTQMQDREGDNHSVGR
ncbi:MAG: hypothetical protein HQL73_10635 [Magnetococcales bacterium]|nr:hypothetical protein [Magnetococcales bacterium]